MMIDFKAFKEVLNKPIYIKQNNKDLSIFLNEFSSLLKAGINSEDAVYILKDQREIKSLNYILNKVYDDLLMGHSLSDSFSRHGNFEEFFITMIKTGEETGRIEEISKNLSLYYKRTDQIDKKVKGALVYPIILMVTAICVLFFIFTYVMPTFLDLFRESENTLPKSTKVLIAIVSFFNNHGAALLVAILIFIFIFVLLYKKTGFKLAVDKFKFKIPIVGKNYSKVLTGKIAMALSISTNAGLNFIDAVSIISEGIGNKYLEERIKLGILEIQNGKRISETFHEIKELPKLFSSMIEVGEQTGELSDILNVISTHYSEESDYAIDNMLRVFEPAIIIVMAIIIGFIVISIATPMFDLINSYNF